MYSAFKALMFLCSLGIAGGTQAAWSLDPQSSESEIEISASAELKVPNDVATLYFKALSQNSSLLTVQTEVNGVMAEATKAIRNFSAEPKIQTVSYSTRPVWADNAAPGSGKISAWIAEQEISVTTEDMLGIAPLVQVAQDANIALVAIRFSLSEETKALSDRKLVEKAVRALNARAESIAAALHIPSESLKFKTLDFSPQESPIVYATRLALSKGSSGEAGAMPSFDAGQTPLRVEVKAKLAVNKEPSAPEAAQPAAASAEEEEKKDVNP
jgi:predicted secreted protein